MIAETDRSSLHERILQDPKIHMDILEGKDKPCIDNARTPVINDRQKYSKEISALTCDNGNIDFQGRAPNPEITTFTSSSRRLLSEKEKGLLLGTIQQTPSVPCWLKAPPPLPGWTEQEQTALIQAYNEETLKEQSKGTPTQTSWQRRVAMLAHKLPGKRSAEDCIKCVIHVRTTKIAFFGSKAGKLY